MCQYLAHMASLPPDPQHNHCVGFSPWCPLGIHGSSNASIRFLVNGFIYMEKCPPPPGFWTSRLESLPALPLRFHVCEWKHLLIVTSLPSLFGVTHWTGECDLEFSSSRGVWSLDSLACLLGLSWNLSFVFLLTLDRKSGKVGSQEVMDGCWSLWQPLSPLWPDFGLSGASEYQ